MSLRDVPTTRIRRSFRSLKKLSICAFLLLVLLITISIATLLQSGLFTSFLHFNQDSLNSGSSSRVKSQHARFRSTCSYSLLRWNRASRLWVPPMCRFAMIYAGIHPDTIFAGRNITDNPAHENFNPYYRRHISSAIPDGVLHIYVAHKRDFGGLASDGGSDYTEQHWPSVLLLDQTTGSKYVWDITKPKSTESAFLSSVPANVVPSEKSYDINTPSTQHDLVSSITQSALEDSFNAFLEAVRAGTQKQYLKEELIEHMPLNGGSDQELTPMDINASFLSDYILNSTARTRVLREKEIFVVFHAPWCGHCRVYLSKFEPLAQQIVKKSVSTIGFYKFDVTANDINDSRFRIHHVPTTYFFPAGSESTAIEFTERRQVREGLIRFLHEHSHQINQAAYNEL